MIKRALGVFVDGHLKGGPGSDDDSDDGLTEAQRRKLEKRLLPGAAPETSSASRRQAGRGYTKEVDSDSDPDDDDDDDNDSDYDPPVYAPENEIRGNFKCELCPYKLILTEKDLELHLNSKAHKKNEARFEHAKEIGVEAYEEECTQRAEAEEERKRARAAGVMSSKKQRNFEYWKTRRERAPKKTGQERIEEIEARRTPEQAAYHADKSQAKLARFLARRAAEAEPAAQKENTGSGKKEEDRSEKSQAKHARFLSRRAAEAEAAAQKENTGSGKKEKRTEAVVEPVPTKKEKRKRNEAATAAQQHNNKGKGKKEKITEAAVEAVPSKKKKRT